MDNDLKKYLGGKVRKYLAENCLTTKDLSDKEKHGLPISKWLINDLLYDVKKKRRWNVSKQYAIINFLGEKPNVYFNGETYELKNKDSDKASQTA